MKFYAQKKIKNNSKAKNWFKNSFSKSLTNLSKMGKALLFPIAVLPIAGILNRIGAQLPSSPDAPWAEFVQSLFSMAGSAVFSNLAILFAIGVAFGLTKDNRGEAALVGFLGMILLTLLLGQGSGHADLPTKIYKTINFPPPTAADIASGKFTGNEVGFGKLFGSAYNDIMANNVLNGILVGVLISYLYNRFNGIELPKVLGFFSGRRLIPVVGILAVLVFSILWAIIFPWIGWILYQISNGLLDATGNRYANAAIAGVYGFLNRLLIPVGLHHVPNTLFWFVFGQFDSGTTANPSFVYGDINGFLSGNVIQNNGSILTAGTFQTGFYPTMMFGLPALCYVFYRNAENQEQRNRVLSLFGPAALVSFLTGITEPIEFAFMFISPLLYLVHAVLTGIFAFIVNLFGMQIGFSFSAGFLDYLLSIPKSVQIAQAKGAIDYVQGVFANPGWIFVVGPVCALTYYFVSNALVKKLKIATPGRGKNKILEDDYKKSDSNSSGSGLSDKAKKIVLGLGGWDNINDYQNCTTRLRYNINDYNKVNEDLIKSAGVLGFKKISDNSVQIIIGQNVEILNNEIISNKNAPLNLNEKNLNSQQQKLESSTISSKKPDVIIRSPIGGKVVSLEKLSDKTFTLIGKGIAIIPNTNEFRIFDDNLILEKGFHTGHAYILKVNNYYLMIHIGIDTVELKNEGKIFDSKFIDKQQVPINKNEVLVKVNFDAIKHANLETVTPIILMNESLSSNDEVEILVSDGDTIQPGDSLFLVKSN